VEYLKNEGFPTYEVIEDLEHKLSQHNNPKAFILRTLRSFHDISTYLLINIDKEYSEKVGEKVLSIGNTNYYKGHYYCHKTLERSCNWIQPNLNYSQATVCEKYVIHCFELFNNFFNLFDRLCLDFDLDIIKIQEENGIVIWIRNLSHLLGYGYEEKLRPIKSYPYQVPELRKGKIEALECHPTEKKKEEPQTFEELFYNPEHAEPCLNILRELQPPAIDQINNYIGKAKGVFPLWIRVLKSHKPEPLIKHFKDIVYKDLLNQKLKGLNLSKDASEFRKQYKRLENDKIELDIKAILSQLSQSGKLGK
jgi:hypothetical protein